MCTHLANHFELHFFIFGPHQSIDNLQNKGKFGKIFSSDMLSGFLKTTNKLGYRMARKVFPPHFDSKRYAPDSILKEISYIQQKENYEACIVHTPLLGRCLQAFPGTVVRIIDSHDIWHQKYLNFKSLGYGKLLSQFRNKDKEINLYRSVDLVLAISLWDHKYLVEHGVNSIYTPVSFKPEPLPAKEPTGHDLLYASGKGITNIDALHYFIGKIMPIVKRQIPYLRLKISNVSDEIRNKYSGRPDIVFLPFFDDAHDAYRGADIVIVPLRYASGLKIKVLESFSLGKPTIVSPAAAQGIPVAEYAQERISINPDIFAEELINALRDQRYRKKLSMSGLAIINNNYSPELVYKDIINHIFHEKSP